MRKLLWMLVAVAMLGGGVSAWAKDKTASGDKSKATTVNGLIKVDGDKITIAADDGVTYLLKSKNDKALAEIKAQDGQKLELKGKVTDEDGTKTLTIVSKGGKKKDAGATPAAGGDKK
jgi:hypothetical protein